MKLESRFDMKTGKWDPAEDYFLGGNRKAYGTDRIHVSAKTYIGEMAKRYLDPAAKYLGAWEDTPRPATSS